MKQYTPCLLGQLKSCVYIDLNRDTLFVRDYWAMLGLFGGHLRWTEPSQPSYLGMHLAQMKILLKGLRHLAIGRFIMVDASLGSLRLGGFVPKVQYHRRTIDWVAEFEALEVLEVVRFTIEGGIPNRTMHFRPLPREEEIVVNHMRDAWAHVARVKNIPAVIPDIDFLDPAVMNRRINESAV